MYKVSSAADVISRIVCKSTNKMSPEEIVAYSQFQSSWNDLPKSLKLSIHSELEKCLNVS
jgi:hypothetical protein